MRAKPGEGDGKELFKCGTLVTNVRSQGSFSFRLFCKRWNCPKCKKFKVNKLQKRIGAWAGIFVYTGVVPEGEKHWIERTIKGDYIAVRFDSEKIIISEKEFPGCTRRNKRTFIIKLPELLAPITKGRRISSPRYKKNEDDPDGTVTDSDEDELAEMTPVENDSLGIVAGCRINELAGMTPIEKAIWLEREPERIIRTKGWKLLEEAKQEGLRSP